MKNPLIFISLFFLLLFSSCKKENANLSKPFCASEYCNDKGKAELITLYNNHKPPKDTLLIFLNVVVTSKNELSELKIDEKIKNLNLVFAPAFIQFELKHEVKQRFSNHTIDEIQEKDNIRRKVTQDLEFENLINLFIVPEGKHLNGFTFVVPDTFINYFNLKCNTIFISNKAWLNQSTAAHELGHFFGLQHTFGKNPTENTTPENIDGSNCALVADFICDTPADPNGLINQNCEFLGLSDHKKHGFNPLVSNYMSYYKNICKNEFTPGQYAAMNGFAVSFRAYLTHKKE